MSEQTLPGEIEVFDLCGRRLYAKTGGHAFAIFEDELEPEELVAIAKDIAARRAGPVISCSASSAQVH